MCAELWAAVVFHQSCLEAEPAGKDSPLTHSCACCDQCRNSGRDFFLCHLLVDEALMQELMLDYVPVVSGVVRQW